MEDDYISHHKDLCPRCAERLYALKDIIKNFCASTEPVAINDRDKCDRATLDEYGVKYYCTPRYEDFKNITLSYHK